LESLCRNCAYTLGGEECEQTGIPNGRGSVGLQRRSLRNSQPAKYVESSWSDQQQHGSCEAAPKPQDPPVLVFLKVSTHSRCAAKRTLVKRLDFVAQGIEAQTTLANQCGAEHSLVRSVVVNHPVVPKLAHCIHVKVHPAPPPGRDNR